MTTRNRRIKNFTSNFGPQRPAAHDVSRLVLEMNGEVVERAEPYTGLLLCGTKPLTPSRLLCCWLCPAHYKYQAKGRLSNSSEPPRTNQLRFERALACPGAPVKGASAYLEVIITACTSHLSTVERVTRLLSHFTAFNVAAGTTRPYCQWGGWHYWQKTIDDFYQVRSVVSLSPREHSIGGNPDGGKARRGHVI
ncbi:hypothetical protein Cgig2_018724 [Carnegiea gigantea]|uniref:Uncharacterized protein n=1 Tax=Carnegiea gigantea TaxID=171969 RepID=A0A9Q1GLZ1_9CARY|nr:hypothetical protein Cgig2_018724 [Carnegiea gigantea]